MAPQQVVLIVEGNLVMWPHWAAFRSDYLEPIISGVIADAQNVVEPPEFALVVFYTPTFHSSCLLQQTAWTTSPDELRHWLSSIDFAGGGSMEAAVAEGLAEGLALCTDLPMSSRHSRHCILVGVTPPHKLPSPLRCPPSSLGSQQSAASGSPWWIADAQMVAGSFSRCGVSLSVIFAPQLAPKNAPHVSGPYAAIFQAAMERPAAMKDALEGLPKKNPHHIVLVADRFTSALRALRPMDNIPLLPAAPAVACPPQSVQLPPASTLPAPSASTQASSNQPGMVRPHPGLPGGHVIMNQQGQLMAQSAGLQRNLPPAAIRGPQPGPIAGGGGIRQVAGQGAPAVPAKSMTSSGSAESLEILGSNPAHLTSVTSHPSEQRQGVGKVPQPSSTPLDLSRQQQIQRAQARPAPSQAGGSMAPQLGRPPHEMQRPPGEDGMPSQFVKVYTGQLVLFVKGQELPLCSLEGFVHGSKQGAGFTRDWPPKLTAQKIVKQADAKPSLPHPGAVESMVFRPGKPIHQALSKLSAQQMALMVDLPRHALAVIYFEEKNKLIGLYCPTQLG